MDIYCIVVFNQNKTIWPYGGRSCFYHQFGSLSLPVRVCFCVTVTPSNSISWVMHNKGKSGIMLEVVGKHLTNYSFLS